MKILVVSLLRVGDVLMSAGVLRDLRAKYGPDAQIDLLVNSQSAGIANLLSPIDRVIEFDRAGLQRGLGEARIPLFESYERLSTLLDQIEGENYDLAINITQNRLSGWIMSLIEARDKKGLVMGADGRGVFGSNWFRYMNLQLDFESAEVFHYNDIFRFALGVETQRSALEVLKETSLGQNEADEALAGRTNFIAIQALSSDSKKDWGLNRFAQALKLFSSRNPGVSLVLLAAPFEKETLRPLVSSLVNEGVDVVLAVTSFEGAYSILKRARLLLTLDTSIKHLGVHAGTRIVEICLGSSDAFRTGADQHGAVIIRASEACAPCVHSAPCHRDHHACAKRIPAEAVALIASEVYANRNFQLRSIAEEFENEIEVLKVDRKSLGVWVAPKVTDSLSEASAARWIDLVARKIWLQGSKQALETVGTEMMRLSAFFRSLYPTAADYEWKHLIEDFERRAMEIEGRINGFKSGIRYLHGTYEDPKKLKEFVRSLIVFRERTKTSALFAPYRRALDQVIEDDISPAFTRFKHISDCITEIEVRTSISLRVLRALNSQLDTPQMAET